MAVTHSFECAAHGVFEARGSSKRIPKCPKGCSAAFVSLVFLQAPGFVSARTRTSDRLVREMADAQGLSDISTSPSRPGGSVADRLRKKANGMKGPAGREYPAYAAAVPMDMAKDFGAVTNKDSSAISQVGLGHKYDAAEWKKTEDGKLRHEGAQGPIAPMPTGSTGTSVERVRE